MGKELIKIGIYEYQKNYVNDLIWGTSPVFEEPPRFWSTYGCIDAEYTVVDQNVDLNQPDKIE